MYLQYRLYVHQLVAVGVVVRGSRSLTVSGTGARASTSSGSSPSYVLSCFLLLTTPRKQIVTVRLTSRQDMT